MKVIHDTTPKPLRAILVGVTLGGEDRGTTQEHLEELKLLAQTRGLDVLTTFTQALDHPTAHTLIGSGKAEEIKTYITAHEVDKVIFDHDLTPAQVKNLSKLWDCEVSDRSLLILDIFAMRARTAQAKVQVELAQYEYLLPRLTGMWTHLSRQKGGSAQMKGPGEKELETDKRIAQHKIHLLKEQLAKIEKQAATQRQQRQKQVRLALVGYTNAGKSTLMRSLTHADITPEDKLFATLTTTVRKTAIDGIPFLLADTVGFIRKLPHTLVAAFKSTLMEVKEADIILHVVDFAHPQHEHHIDVVHKTLEEIGAHDIPKVILLNKQDRCLGPNGVLLSEEPLDVQNAFYEEVKVAYEKRYGLPILFCSAIKSESIVALRRSLYKQIYEKYMTIYPNAENLKRSRSSTDRTRVS